MSTGGNEIRIGWQSEMGSVIRDQETLTQSVAKLNTKVEDLKSSTREASALFGNMQAAGRRMTAANETDLERYQRKLGEVNKLLAEKQITEETAAREKMRLGRELLKLGDDDHQSQERAIKILGDRAAKEADLHAAARKWAAATETTQERQKRQLAELADLRQRGLLTEEQHGRAIASVNEKNVTGLQKIIKEAGPALQAAIGVGSALATVATVAGVIKADYEKIQQQLHRSAEYGKDIGEIKSTALLNAPTWMSGDELTARVDRLAAAGAGDRLSLARQIGASYGASGVATPGQQDSFIAKTAKVMLSPEGREAFSRTALAFAGNNGLLDNPEAAIGFLAAAQGQSFVRNPEEFAQSAGPVLNTARISGFGERTAAALFGTMTRTGEDSTGQTASNNMIQAIEQLTKLRRQLNLPPSADGDAIIAALQDPKNKAATIKLLGTDRRQGTLQMGARYNAAFRELITGGTAFEMYREARSAIPEAGPESVPFYEAKVRQQESDPEIAMQRRANIYQKTTQGVVAGQERIKAGTEMMGFSDLMETLYPHLPMDMYYTTKADFTMRNWWSGDTQAASEGALSNLLNNMQGGERGSRDLIEAGQRKVGDGDQTVVQVLQSILGELRRQRTSGASPNGSRPSLEQSSPREP